MRKYDIRREEKRREEKKGNICIYCKKIFLSINNTEKISLNKLKKIQNRILLELLLIGLFIQRTALNKTI